MNKVIVLIGFVLLYTLQGFGQTSPNKTLTRTECNVDAQGIFDGDYKFYYKDKLQVHGTYQNGKKQGLWVYNIDNEYNFSGIYKDDKPDSIWVHFLNKKPYLIINYRTGESRLFYPNGNPRYTQFFENGKWHFEEFNNKGGLKRQLIKDSIFEYLKVYDDKNRLVGDVIFKNSWPYEINNNKGFINDYIYEGELVKGNGLLLLKKKNPISNKFFLLHSIELRDSKPNGIYIKYFENGKVMIKGIYENGFLNGKCEVFNNSGGQIKEINFLKQDSLRDKHDIGLEVEGYAPYFYYEEMPLFPGENPDEFEELAEYLKNTLLYPEVAVENKVQGRVIVEFIVNSDGRISDAKIKRDGILLLNNEAIRVIKNMPYWRPATQNGHPVKVQMSLPVNFKLK